jgi:hypothetical protein
VNVDLVTCYCCCGIGGDVGGDLGLVDDCEDGARQNNVPPLLADDILNNKTTRLVGIRSGRRGSKHRGNTRCFGYRARLAGRARRGAGCAGCTGCTRLA